jgi:site-specific recombinase XerD
MRTLYYTGIRRRQLVNIQMKDLNFHSKTLKASLLGSKTYREWDIPIHPNLIPELQKLTQESEKALGRKLRSDDHLFAIRRFNQRYAANLDNPDQMKREQVSGFFKRLSGKIEGRIGAHRLRHTTATTLCNPPDGAPDLFAAQDLLGHTELSTTRTYVHTKIDRMRREVGRLPDMKVF